MAIKYVKRLAGPYVGVGQTTFTFSFLIYEASDVYVGTAMSEAERTSILEINTDYTVSMNADQQATPGGTITLKTPLVEGQIVVIGSDLDYEQFLQLTNYSRFPPELVNKALDRLCIQIQQIVEKMGRTLSVPATSSETPESMIERLLKAQKEAQQYAKQAEESYQNAKDVEDRLTSQEGTLLEDLKAEGRKQVGNVKAEGDIQAERLNNIFDTSALASGMACSRRCWEVKQPISAGQEIILPNAQKYVVGRNHLMLYLDDLYIDPQHFTEVGTADTLSSKITLAFDLKVNPMRPHYLTAMVIPLGRQDTSELFDRVKVLEDALAQLSRTVAYVQTKE